MTWKENTASHSSPHKTTLKSCFYNLLSRGKQHEKDSPLKCHSLGQGVLRYGMSKQLPKVSQSPPIFLTISQTQEVWAGLIWLHTYLEQRLESLPRWGHVLCVPRQRWWRKQEQNPTLPFYLPNEKQHTSRFTPRDFHTITSLEEGPAVVLIWHLVWPWSNIVFIIPYYKCQFTPVSTWWLRMYVLVALALGTG